MSGVPLLVEGSGLEVLVVGGGAVAARKARTFLDAGARVRVVAPTMHESLTSLADAHGALELERRGYRDGDVGDATLVVVATNDRAVNARVAADARRAHRLVNVADAPDDGNVATMATHRAGGLVIGVSAGGVPAAATRIRDAIAARFDARYAEAVETLAAARRARLAEDRGAWATESAAVVGDDFCDRVEDGTLVDRVRAWR